MENKEDFFDFSIKDDKGKVMYHLIPPEILEGLAEVFTFGFNKYAKPNDKETKWRDVEPERIESAMFRHLIAYKKGEIYDKESGLHHLKHMAWCAVALMYNKCK